MKIGCPLHSYFRLQHFGLDTSKVRYPTTDHDLRCTKAVNMSIAAHLALARKVHLTRMQRSLQMRGRTTDTICSLREMDFISVEMAIRPKWPSCYSPSAPSNNERTRTGLRSPEGRFRSRKERREGERKARAQGRAIEAAGERQRPCSGKSPCSGKRPWRARGPSLGVLLRRGVNPLLPLPLSPLSSSSGRPRAEWMSAKQPPTD